MNVFILFLVAKEALRSIIDFGPFSNAQYDYVVTMVYTMDLKACLLVINSVINK